MTIFFFFINAAKSVERNTPQGAICGGVERGKQHTFGADQTTQTLKFSTCISYVKKKILEYMELLVCQLVSLFKVTFVS